MAASPKMPSTRSGPTPLGHGFGPAGSGGNDQGPGASRRPSRVYLPLARGVAAPNWQHAGGLGIGTVSWRLDRMVWKTSAHLAGCPIAAAGQVTALPDPFSECFAAWGQDSLSIHVAQWEKSGLS